MMKKYLSLLFTSILFFCSLNTWASPLPAPLIEPIGDADFKADTSIPLAQKYFNQGMVFFYGFDYLEAIRSFEASIQLDPNCSRCQFALALSLGSITNAFIKGDELERANKLIAAAKTKDPLTQELFNALRARYKNITHPIPSMETNSDKPHCAQNEIALPPENKLAFSNALFSLMQKFPEEKTLHALFAYSIFGTENWEFYDTLLDTRPYTQMMINTCKQILKNNPNHIGAIHYYIHALEWSKDPAQALTYADKLSSLAPLAEHLVHMPSHIYLRMGNYNQAVTQNLQAIEAYQKYAALCRKQGFQPAINFLNQHNYDFLFVSAIFAGRADIAYQTADNMRKETPLAWLNKGVYFQRFYALKFYAIAHFGGWEKLQPLEKSLQTYPYLKAMWAYDKALHALAMHQLHDYDMFFEQFDHAVKENNTFPHYQKAFANNLAIAKEILLANKERYLHHWQEAILHWYTATSLQKPAGDPPEWYFSTILGLGYTFLDAHQPKQAILTFESSLNANPENGWALYGLAKAYGALNQYDKANEWMNRFKKIWHSQAVALPLKQGSDLFLSSTLDKSFRK
jgi:tetratricopeptide (TPR) repeat protein